MRLVTIDSLTLGTELAMPVRTYSGNVILNIGISITENYIQRLKQLGVNSVYVRDDRFNDVDNIESLDYRTKNSAIKVLKDVHNALNKGSTINEYVIKDVAKYIVDFAIQTSSKGVSILATEVSDEQIFEHSVNVALLSAFIGQRMGYNYIQLSDLVVGALIHDLGREGKDENTEHVQKAFDYFRKMRGLNLHSSVVCLEHHEKYDGTGFPRKISGTSISEYSRIVKVADVYEGILHGYNNSQPIMPHQAYETLLAMSGSDVDPEIVKVFRDAIVFYPNGCAVQLSNGLKAVVIRQNQGSPHRPVIRVFSDSGVIGEINLVKSLTIFIKDVIMS